MKNLHLFYTSALKFDETLKDRYDDIMLRNIFVNKYCSKLPILFW